jgi:integrase
MVTKKDVENLLSTIERANSNGDIDTSHYLNYKALVLFGAFTGQRPLATIARLTVKQFKKTVTLRRPVLDVFPWQDKIRMQHYCPLHPQDVEAIVPALGGRHNNEPMFTHFSFQQWLRHTEIRLQQSNLSMVNGDLRKFAEQYGDIIRWEQFNRAYILTHGVSGVDWRFYKHPLPEHVYDVVCSAGLMWCYATRRKLSKKICCYLDSCSLLFLNPKSSSLTSLILSHYSSRL